MARKDWHRYIKASFAVMLKDFAASNGLSLVVEGVDDRGPAFISASHKIEVIVGAPSTTSNSGSISVSVPVFAVVTSVLTGDAYSHQDVTGLVAEALDTCIAVREWEVGNTDDPATIGYLQNDAPVAADYFRASNTDETQNTTIETNFLGEWEE